MQSYLLSYDTGVVNRLILAPGEDLGDEAVARCEAIGRGANVLDPHNYRVLGRVELGAGGYQYVQLEALA